jgi:cell division protein FtsQ
MAKRQQKPRHARRETREQRGGWVMPLVIGSLMLLVGGALATAFHLLSQPERLPLRVIEISGELQHLERGSIEQVVGRNIDGGFFTVDMNRLRQAVVAMPWVADVSIRRSWPDRLSMFVTEQVPVARWGDAALINVAAEVFEPGALEPFAGLVKLSGPAGSEQRVVALFKRVVAEARSRGLSLREIELDQRRHWWLRFDEDLVVSLGRDEVDSRLAQFFRVYPTLATQMNRRPARIDMRYSHGFAVRWHEETGEPAHDAQPGDKEKA